MAPIITAHMSQTATTSGNDHSALIGIISETTGDDMFAADHRMSDHPTAMSPNRMAKPLRPDAPVRLAIFGISRPKISSNT